MKIILINQRIRIANKGGNSYSLEDVIFRESVMDTEPFPFQIPARAAVTEKSLPYAILSVIFVK